VKCSCTREFHDNTLCKILGANRVHYGQLENRELANSFPSLGHRSGNNPNKETKLKFKISLNLFRSVAFTTIHTVFVYKYFDVFNLIAMRCNTIIRFLSTITYFAFLSAQTQVAFSYAFGLLCLFCFVLFFLSQQTELTHKILIISICIVFDL